MTGAGDAGPGAATHGVLAAGLADVLAERDRLAAELAAARAEVEALRADKARLDYLDACNAALNARYGTSYRWRLVQTHIVTRLMLGNMDVDLHDSDGSLLAHPSCREAIDERIEERDRARAARTSETSDGTR